MRVKTKMTEGVHVLTLGLLEKTSRAREGAWMPRWTLAQPGMGLSVFLKSRR